jgi:NADPH-dependent 2,4-dienoyl-CoA reductase/sulfur reductase-like enzyme
MNSGDKKGLRGFAMRSLVRGVGPSGLVVARNLRKVKDVTVAECKDEIGGLRNYTDQTTPASDLFKSYYGH